MNRAIVLHWKSDLLQALVLSGSGGNPELEEAFELPSDDNAAELGRRLAEKLAPFSPNRAKLVVAVGRELVRWQHLSLPPCPDEELPDLVRMQADYASNGGDELAGLDFLPLVGDEEVPHRVWTVALPPAQLARLRKLLSVAELEATHVVPAVLGWPESTGSHRGGSEGTIYTAPLGEEAAIWATVDHRVVVFRQLHLPGAETDQFQPALIGELRRTMLAFGQQHPDGSEPLIKVVGDGSPQADVLRDDLQQQLLREVEFVAPTTPTSDSNTESRISSPSLGLGAAALSGTAPLVDLINPRRRPPPKTRRQTYYLAGAAALALVALLGFQGYRNLQVPVENAAEMQAEIDLRKENEEKFAKAERDAADIRTWEDNSVNLLEELRVITQQVRPKPLDAEDFPADDDVVIGKIVLRTRQYTITAFTKQNSDLQPVEYRLRDGIHRVRRGETERSDEVSGYPVKFESIVDVLSGPPPASQQGGNP